MAHQRTHPPAGSRWTAPPRPALLPEPLSHVDGALVSCGSGTAYEGPLRLQLSGQDRLLVTGLGPVGLAGEAHRVADGGAAVEVCIVFG
ncbi:hypothetical protein [Geodermatophilus sp. URMC 62]|uniref:hypothetical protein n=1 Tax=Geodermatophilus sp. URMC 62 TaxID=3423414 RepID=UPI00406D00E1